MWHELVLSGVGGRTIEEAQRRMTYGEFLQWMAYRRKRGSFNLGMRVERGTALIATILRNQNRPKDSQPVSFYSLAPYHEEPKISLEEAMEKWK